LDLSGSGYDTVAESCEQDDETLGAMKYRGLRCVDLSYVR